MPDKCHRAWKNQLAPDGTKVRFIADDKADLTIALGMLFDATPLLGGPRSKVRFAVPPCSLGAHR